jgi:hypothetical protein
VPGDACPLLRYLPRTDAGPGYPGCHLYTLAYLPTLKLLATFRTAAHCKAHASDLARLGVRWGGSEPPGVPGMNFTSS